MSKKIPVYLSKDELEELLWWAKVADHESQLNNTNLLERLEAELDTFEPDMHKEDKDGYGTLTDEAKEGLRENEAWLKSGE